MLGSGQCCGCHGMLAVLDVDLCHGYIAGDVV